MCLKESCFSRLMASPNRGRELQRVLWLKLPSCKSSFLLLVKPQENLLIIGLLIILRNTRFYLWLADFNLFVPNAPFLYLLKTVRFSGVFKGQRKGTLRKNGLIQEKLTIFQLTTQVNLGAIDVKVKVPVHDEKLYVNMLDLSFPSKLDWGSYLLSNA